MCILIHHGVDVNIRDAKLCTPLVVAAKHGRLRSVKYLIQKSADVTLGDVDGCTFLHHLCRCERLTSYDLRDVISDAYLADINQTNDDGQTVLHVTAVQGRGDKISLLLQKGCDANLKDNMGRTALFGLLDHCDPGRCLLGIECLLMETTQVNIQDRDGNYPMCFSRYKKDIPGILTDLQAMAKTPSTLFYFCVQKVRHAMGRDRQDVRHLSHLQLPGVITAEIVLLPLLLRKEIINV